MSDIPKILLACDLDATFLHSRHHYAPGDLCVEYLNAKPLSLLSKEAHELYQHLPREILFAPVTTRARMQYQRIFYLSTPTPKFAVYAHGAHLFRDGVEDEEWGALAQRLLAPAAEEFAQAERIMESLGAERIRRVDNTYVQCWTRRAEWMEQRLRELMHPALTETLWGGQKLFVMSRAVNKGMAVRRLKGITGAQRMFAAGDSPFDVPMLAVAERAYVPYEKMAQRVRDSGGKDVRVIEGDFSAGILKDVIASLDE
ncbi:MAG: hypothetical protein IJY85_00410 [Ruminococcus sp.]|nr:hypothetical protein [Ruminococcus sp.]